MSFVGFSAVLVTGFVAPAAAALLPCLAGSDCLGTYQPELGLLMVHLVGPGITTATIVYRALDDDSECLLVVLGWRPRTEMHWGSRHPYHDAFFFTHVSPQHSPYPSPRCPPREEVAAPCAASPRCSTGTCLGHDAMADSDSEPGVNNPGGPF